jgi:hypothetical protein
MRDLLQSKTSMEPDRYTNIAIEWMKKYEGLFVYRDDRFNDRIKKATAMLNEYEQTNPCLYFECYLLLL